MQPQESNPPEFVDPQEAKTLEILEGFRQTEIAMVAKSVDSFYQGLVLDPINNPNKLPESIFVSVFLPYFNGEKDFKDSPHLLGEWYAIAGSHVSEVQITDAKGIALYNVPPFINNKAINTTHNAERKEMSLYDIDGAAAAMSRNIPAQGKQYRERALAGKILDMTADGQSPEDYLSRWKAIFERYDNQTIKKADDGLTAVTHTAVRVSEDELEF